MSSTIAADLKKVATILAMLLVGLCAAELTFRTIIFIVDAVSALR